MVAIVIGLWAINELSFDRFHQNKDRIYRSVLGLTQNGNFIQSGAMFRPLGEQAKDELPDIEDMCRVYISNNDITIDNVLHTDIRTFMADSNFFAFFTFPLREGDLNQALSSPDRVVISEAAALRYFPQQNPVGQIIRFEERDFAVSGVMKDMPKNSSLQTDFVFPFFGRYADMKWGDHDNFVTFFLLRKGVLPGTLKEPLTQLALQTFEPYKSMGGITITPEPLVEMHFKSMFFDPIVKGNKSLVMVFILTALVILVISCINFANLFVSTSFIRAKTIGIKKTVGAKKLGLMREFYMETACYVLLSTGIGLALVTLILPMFNNFTQAALTLEFSAPQLYLFLAALFVPVVLMAGSFPALYMTRFNVIETLSGKFKGKKISFFQKSLVITQFAASITLLMVVAFMQKQVNYIVSYDLGFNREHVMYVRGRENFEQNYKAMEGEFLQESSIANVARKNALPTDWTQGWGIKRIPSDDALPVLMEMCRVSPNYFDFFDMQIIDGENPFFLESSEETDVVINESAARLLGYEQPVGEMIAEAGGNNRYTIRGVVRNAYTKSLHKEVDPQVYLRLHDDWKWNAVFFKIPGDPQRAISFIEQKWKEREADYPFEYRFLDDTYQQLYSSEMNADKVLTFAMLITLIITVAGLFAMAYYATQRRVREIAIRKVYGATVKDIFMLLNRDFLLWVAIAFIIACPIAFYGLHKWLEGFVVKTSLNLWLFLAVGAVALLVALLTTGFQTWKAARANPVEGIKSE
jgi:putative ABC transport system permease protein